jgi:hypothetical protein
MQFSHVIASPIAGLEEREARVKGVTKIRKI